MRTPTVSLSLVLLLLFLSSSAPAQWAANGAPVTTVPKGQYHPVATSDEAGGAIVVWEDNRNEATAGVDVYAQRIDAGGFAMWTPGGIPLCTEAGDQDFLAIVSDGAGGAIVAWHDARAGSANQTIYAQRISSVGSLLWRADGVSLCSAPPVQRFHSVVSDGAHGAIVAWVDTRSGALDIYAQRVDASGAIKWSSNAAPVCTVAGLQDAVLIAVDGSGGAIVGWTDERNGPADIYAQRLDAAGAPVWTVNGVAVCTAALAQFGGSMCS